MRNAFYSVTVGMPGYLPNDAYICTTRKEAEYMAHSEAEYFRDAGYKVSGNMKDGYTVYHNGYNWQYIEIYGPVTAQDLGYDSVEDLCESEGIDF